jgi:DNA-binding transcriptional MerR regulator
VGYTAAQAAKLAGCSVSQLRYWSRSQLVTPTAEGGGYSFRDLVALRVVRSLLDAGLSSTRGHDDGQILDALRAGQLALFVAVDRVAAEVDAEVRAFTADRAAFVEQLKVRRDSMQDHPARG